MHSAHKKTRSKNGRKESLSLARPKKAAAAAANASKLTPLEYSRQRAKKLTASTASQTDASISENIERESQSSLELEDVSETLDVSEAVTEDLSNPEMDMDDNEENNMLDDGEEETDNTMDGQRFTAAYQAPSRRVETNNIRPPTTNNSNSSSNSNRGGRGVQLPARSVPSVYLYDDELFTLSDTIVRKSIYAPLSSADGNKLNDIKHIICFNLTQDHFEPGATEWYHLKDAPFQFFTSFFNTLAYFTNKKARQSLPEKPTRFPNANKSPANATTETARVDGDLEPKESTNSKEELLDFTQVDKGTSLFVETLVTVDGRVGGFRIWLMHKSEGKEHSDMFSIALRESLLEANKVKDLAAKQINSITKSSTQKGGGGGSGKAKGMKQYGISKEFSFAKFDSFEAHFLSLVRPYFTGDENLLVGDIEEDEKKLREYHEKRHFKDTRAFHSYDAVRPNAAHRDYTKDAHPCNITRAFTKEAAMFYHVRAAKIIDSQCRLESYCSNVNATAANHTPENAHAHSSLKEIAEQEAQGKVYDANRLPPLPDVADLSGAALDEDFNRFPHESITYPVDSAFLSAEFMSRNPLPHRLGSTLYTVADQLKLKEAAHIALSHEEEAFLSNKSRIDASREEEDSHVDPEEMTRLLDRLLLDADEEEEPTALSRSENIYAGTKETNRAKYGNIKSYLGIHETEFELTAEIMLSEPNHLDKVTLESLKCATIPRTALQKFMTSKKNEIDARLKQILTNLGYKNRIVIRECPEEIGDASSGARKSPQTKKRFELREYPATGMDLVTHDYALDEKERANILQLPYLASSIPGVIVNRNKKRVIAHKAHEYLRRYAAEHAEDDEAARRLQEAYEERDYDAKVASGYVGHFKDTIVKWRPWGNSLHVLKTQLSTLKTDEVYSRRDIFLRLDELATDAYKNLEKAYFNPLTGKIPIEREEEYMKARRELRDALFVEFWHEFFTNPSVSLACEGVRSDLLKQRLSYIPPAPGEPTATTNAILGKKTIGQDLPIYDYDQELRPYSAFRVYVRSLFTDQAGITFNYKIVETLYFAKFHHGRWYPECNDPKLNIILSGNGAAGKSKALQEIKKTLPTSVGDMVTHITDQAFNVDRNLNDMLLIYEEFQNKYLGYTGGSNSRNGATNGNSAGSDKDTTNFFKARLTSGRTMTMSWYENEETGLRDMKVSKADCQGNIFGASNNDFTDADVNVMSRFILLSVPKSKNQIKGLRPQDRNKPGYGTDVCQSNEVYEQHKEIHRVVYLCEQMFKSNVTGDSKFGVNVDGARIMIDFILDNMQKCYGIQTNDVRKRGHILELARCMALSFAVWFGLTSEETRHLFYDPHEPSKYIGFNPRVVLEGILPYAIVTKDMVFDAITCLSSLWIHEYQDNILEVFATKKCKLHELKREDFMRRPKVDVFTRNLTSSRGGDFAASYGGGGGGGGGHGRLSKDDCEYDYNYIVMKGKTREAIHHLLSISLGEMIVASNDIGKLFHDLSQARIESCEGYEWLDVAGAIDPETGFQGEATTRLVRAGPRGTMDRYVVEFGQDPVDGKQTIGVLVAFLKQKLGHLLKDEKIENLNKKSGYETIIRSLDDLRRLDPEEGEPEMQQDDVDDEETQIEEDEECDEKERALFKEIRRVGMIRDETSTLFVKSFKDVMENEVFEDIGGSKEMMRALEDTYRNPVTKKVPWMTFVTADPPKPRDITVFYPELKTTIVEAAIDVKPVYFVDQFSMMSLKRKKNGKKMIINNYNTISPSTRASLSIYKNACLREEQLKKKRSLSKASEGDDAEAEEDDDDYERMNSSRGTLKKARIDQYSKTSAWVVDRDIDYIFCQEHLRNIAYPGLYKRKPGAYQTPNYPASMYMSIMEKREAKARELGIEVPPLLEYPFVNIVNRVSQSKEKINAEINPDATPLPSFGAFMDSNLAENSRFRLCSSTNGEMDVEAECLIGRPLQRSAAEERKKRYALAKENQ